MTMTVQALRELVEADFVKPMRDKGSDFRDARPTVFLQTGEKFQIYEIKGPSDWAEDDPRLVPLIISETRTVLHEYQPDAYILATQGFLRVPVPRGMPRIRALILTGYDRNGIQSASMCPIDQNGALIGEVEPFDPPPNATGFPFMNLFRSS